MRIQSFKPYSRGTIVQPERATFVVPAFTLSAAAWAGSSNILAEFPFENDDYQFSLKLPIAQFGSAFIAAIRWVEDDVIRRFKLWDDSTAVLFFPVYDGERIGLNARLEIWSLNTADAPTLVADYVFSSSVLAFPSTLLGCSTQCAVPSASLTLTQATPSSLPPSAYCNPFCNNLCG